MTRSKLTLCCLVASALGTASGCGTSGGGPSSAPATAGDPSAIAVVYRSRCGACHRPVAPGSEPAGKLHAELLEHRKRTRLSEAQWAGLEAFLAPRAPAQ
jgi:mono/diheme cytochrome c family protein